LDARQSFTRRKIVAKSKQPPSVQPKACPIASMRYNAASCR
jgi:hypothetical protein